MSSTGLRCKNGGWEATGTHFYIWQEDEISARAWLEALTPESLRRRHSKARRKDTGAHKRGTSRFEATDWRNAR
jgi:hypothetical protein